MITLSMVTLTLSVILAVRTIPRLMDNRESIYSHLGLRRLRIAINCIRAAAVVLICLHVLSLIVHVDNSDRWEHAVWIGTLSIVLAWLRLPDELRYLEVELRAREEAPDIEYRQ